MKTLNSLSGSLALPAALLAFGLSWAHLPWLKLNLTRSGSNTTEPVPNHPE